MPRRVALLLVLAAAALLPLGLAVRAFADEWRAPNLWPQQFGLRAVGVVSHDPSLRSAIIASVVVALTAALLAFPLAWPAARSLGATPRRPLLLALLALPLVVPGYAFATGISAWFVRLGIPGGVPSLMLAHLPSVLAYEILLLLPAFDARLRHLGEAGAVLAARPAIRTLLIELPARRGAVVAALVVGFTVSWAQYGTSLAVGAGTVTLPVVLVPFAQADPQVAALLALIALLPPVIGLIASARSASTLL